VAEWQTRQLQVLVSERAWGFKSPLAHDESPAVQGILSRPAPRSPMPSSSRRLTSLHVVRVARIVLTVLAGSLGIVACGSDTDPSADGATVFAAASLTDAFTELGDAFLLEHPGADLTFSFASSADLARQIIEGAPVDVFASADPTNMAKVVDAGAASAEPRVFATNRAEIVVAPGNPLGISSIDDLTRDDLVVVVCAPEAPCGSYASDVFDNAGVEVTPDSYEANVKAVVTKVMLGEADAGVVYATDVLAAGDAVFGIEIRGDLNVVAEYPIVAVSDSDVARSFIDFVTGTVGQGILSANGFGAP
jgi:molybdate transport system substrate-binding protein